MATKTISQVTSIVKENNPIRIDFLNEETPVVSSLDIALHFQKKHKHVLRDIDQTCSNLPKEFNEPNFGRVEYIDAKGERRRYYALTRDAFTLLVMGFTGTAALKWKLKYIEVFNSIEAALRENIRTDAIEATLALPAIECQRKVAYLDGLKEGRKLQKRRDGLTRLIKIREYLHKGLTHREIGKILGVTRQAVTDTLRRARKTGLAA